MSNFSQTHWPQHARLPCCSPSLGVCPNSCLFESVTPSNHLILCCPLLLLPCPSQHQYLNSIMAITVFWMLHISLLGLISAFRDEALVLSIFIIVMSDLFCGDAVPGTQNPDHTGRWESRLWWIIVVPQATIFESLEQLDVLCVFLIFSEYEVLFPFPRWGSRGLRELN